MRKTQNFSTISQLFVPSIREYHFYFKTKLFFCRIHCFNNFESNGACIDLELSYFLECSTLSKTGRNGKNATCIPDGKFYSVFEIKTGEISAKSQK